MISEAPAQPSLAANQASPATVFADWLPRIGHDLRAILAGIHGYAGLLATEAPGPLTPAQRRYVAGIGDQVADLGWQLEIALGLMRVAAGAEAAPHEPCDIAACVARSASTARGPAATRGVTLVLAPDAVPVLVDARPAPLVAALVLVLGAAVRSCPEGGIVVAAVDPGDPRAVNVRLTVDGAMRTDDPAVTVAWLLAELAGGAVAIAPDPTRDAWQWVLNLPTTASSGPQHHDR